MDSKSDYGSLEALFGLRPSSEDPLAAMFGTDSHPDTSNPYGADDSLQLAPLYSNPRHQQERASSLNRYPGWQGDQSYDEYYEDGHEENHESHVSYDASGMHFGVNMSRTHQTPFGPARTDVGMQMSIGHGGMMFSTRSSSSIGGGGHGGLLMMSRFGRSPDYSGLGQSMFGPLGIFPPLAGLLSPLGGMFSPMIGCSNPYHQHPLFGLRRPYRTTPQNQDSSTGSDGPIIEEIFDDEEKGYSGSKGETAFMSPLAVEYKEEETDASLGLGLLPDAESECRNDSQNVQELITSSSNEILNDFAYTESSQTSHSESDNEGDDSRKKGTEIYETETGAVSRLDIENFQEDRNGLAVEAEINRNRLSEITDNTVPTKNVLQDFQDFQESSKLHQIDEKTEINSVTKDRPKFTKQTFRNPVSKSDDVFDNSSFLKPISPSDRNRTLESQLDADKACDQPMKVNKNKQMTKSKKGMVNKNSSIRRRNDSSSSSSSQQSQTTDIKLSENINFVPKSKIYQVEQNETNSAMQQSETTIVRSEFPQKPDENSTYSSEKNRLALEDNCLSGDTVDRYASLHETNKNSNFVNEDISKKEDKCKDVWPESLQESSNFTGDIENSTAAKTSSHSDCITNKLKTYSENVHGNDSTREEIDSDTAFTGEVHKQASVPHRKFGGGLMEKLSSAEQKGLHEQTMDGTTEVEGGQIDTEVQNIEQGDIMMESENDTGSSFENKSKDEVTLSRLQDFQTSESDMNLYIHEASNKVRVERKMYKYSLCAKESDMSRTKDDDQVSILCNRTPNEDTKQSNHEIQTAPEVKTEERAVQQTKEKHLTQRINEQIRKPEHQKLEPTSHTSETLRDRPFSYESPEDQIHLKDEGNRTSPVLENFQFVQDGGYEMSEASRREIQVLQDASLSPDEMVEATVPIPVVHQEHNKSCQSSQRQQTMNVSCTSGYQQIRKGIQGQAQCNHHSNNQDTFVNGGHCNHREDTHHSRGYGGQHMCEHLKRQLQCEHRKVQLNNPYCSAHKYVCIDCRKLMSSDEYAEIKTDNDDIFQHPDWKFLNEYRDVNGQFTEPRQRPKKTVNKNAAVRTHAAASASPGQSGSSGMKETRPSSVSFRDLVESVGLVMKDVYPDGNCLFTAVCDQLRIRGDFSYTPRDLRHAAVDYLRDHPCQEDGTPLQEFLTDEERNWERYLSSMRREGHWGDHFVIWALVHVLNRRFIIYRGDSELHKTVVEPSGPLTEESFQESVNSTGVATDGSDTKPTDTELDKKPLLKSVEKDEVYLGHVSQSHYVSLRPHDWHDKLFEALKNKQTSCLVGSNPESNTIGCEMQLNEDVPQTHLAFGMKYILMSDMIFCPNSKKETSERINDRLQSTWEMFTQQLDVMNGLLIGSNAYKRVKEEYKALMVPKDTRVYNVKPTGILSAKDLILSSSNCSAGYTKLLAIDPFPWMNNLTEDNCLKQLCFPSSFTTRATNTQATSTQNCHLAFLCEWPEVCADWLTRNRVHGWPTQEVIDHIRENGCRVIPKCKSSCDCPLAEWKFTFDHAEKVISEHAVTEEQLDCFLIVKVVLDSVLNYPLTLTQLKHMFFYMCEDTEDTVWKTELSTCVRMFLSRVKECVSSKNIPNYFMPQVNLLECCTTDEYISQCVECVDILQKHPLTILFFLTDKQSHINFEVNDLLDRLIEDARLYSLKNGIYESIRYCFLPILAESISAMVRRNNYMGALERCQAATEQISLRIKGGEVVQLQDTVLEVIFCLSRSLHRWMFAFVADQKLGTFFIETVCERQDVVSIFDYYGSSLADTLHLQSGDILVPFRLVNLQNLAETTNCMFDILQEFCPLTVYREVMKFFVSNHVHRLVQYVRNRTDSDSTQKKFLTMVLDKIGLALRNSV